MTRNLSGREVACKEAPISCLSSRELTCGSKPQTRTEPRSRLRKPSRISTVVVLPAPLGPSRPKTSPLLDAEADAANGLHIAVVLNEIIYLQDGFRHDRQT